MTQLSRAAAALALALTTSACGSSATPASPNVQDQISVGGAFGTAPTVTIDGALELDKSSSWVVEKGKGDPVTQGGTTILQLTLVDGRTGKVAISTLDKGERPLEAQVGEQMFPSLVRGLQGQPAGSRVVVASTGQDAYGDNGAPQVGLEAGDPVVMVADILSADPTTVLDGPTGPAPKPPATVPALLEKDGVPSGFDFARAVKPKKLVVVPLREGTGPAVESPDRVTVHYLLQVWDAGKPVESSYAKEPSTFSIGLSGVIPAWDRALVGQKEGARVLLIAPPDVAYGAKAQPDIPASSTLVFVVDVLGVG